MDALQWLLVSIDGTCAVHLELLKKDCAVGRQTRKLLQGLLERPLAVKEQFNLFLQQRTQYPLQLAAQNRSLGEFPLIIAMVFVSGNSRRMFSMRATGSNRTPTTASCSDNMDGSTRRASTAASSIGVVGNRSALCRWTKRAAGGQQGRRSNRAVVEHRAP